MRGVYSEGGDILKNHCISIYSGIFRISVLLFWRDFVMYMPEYVCGGALHTTNLLEVKCKIELRSQPFSSFVCKNHKLTLLRVLYCGKDTIGAGYSGRRAGLVPWTVATA